MSVSVTTSADVPGGRGACVRSVDHERVEQTLVTLCHMRRARPADEPLHHPVERAADGETTDQRADGDGPDAARLERGADAGDGEDRMDGDERVARSDHDRVRGSDRVEDAGRRAALLGAVVDERVDRILVAPGDEPLLEREGALGRDEQGAEPVVGRRQKPRREACCGHQAGGHDRERLALAQRLRAHEVEADVEIAEHEPALATPGAGRLERLPRLAGPSPATLGVVQAGEAVEDGVEIGRDVQAEHLEVVADVADDRQLARREHVVETRGELGAADAAGEENDVHAVRAARTLC